MPNYSPSEETSLMALLAALRGGMEPTTGYQMFSDVLNQQATRVDERQARLASLQDLIANQALAGQSLKGVNALVDAYVPGGGVPPMIQGSIDALYPEQSRMVAGPQEYAPPVSAPGNTPSEVGAGALAGQPYPGPMPMQEQTFQPQISPAAPRPDPVAVLQAEADTISAQQTIDEANATPVTLGSVVSAIYEAKSLGQSDADTLAEMRMNPQVMEIVAKNYSGLGKIFPGLFPDRSQPRLGG